jgi:hypothetical protein
MIHNMWNSQTFGTDFLSGPRPREWDILHDNLITRLFRERMPSHWDVKLQVSGARPGPDAILSMSPAADINIPVFTEVKGTVEPRDIPRLVDQLNSYSEERPHLVVAPFLSPRTQQLREIEDKILVLSFVFRNLFTIK